MSQNISSAVMAQRREPHDSLDFFPTPLWATRALCEFLGRQHTEHLDCWEPACGGGHMARPLREYFKHVYATDVCDYGFGSLDDFLLPRPGGHMRFDWIVTNPPFRLAQEFAETALHLAMKGVALLVRTQFLESRERYEKLFSKTPPTWVLQFSERVTLLKGRLFDPETDDRSATAYCWMIWQLPYFNCGTRLSWIAPCRSRLERPEDYR
jgi:hypothetical protein